jgi:hypothetical protein
MMEHNSHMLLSALADCITACNKCAAACLREKEVSELSRCIELDLECAEICTLAAYFISRGSEQTQKVVKLCADICAACHKECEKHSHMEHCRICAEACKKCAGLSVLVNVVEPAGEEERI